jgi:hypothetical protein
MQLLIPIGANIALGLALFALFFSRRSVDDARLKDGDTALRLFREQFPDADGAATVTTDQRGALIALNHGTDIGLLQRRGRRWTARKIAACDICSVALTQGNALRLSLADFGWPRAYFQVADPEARTEWLARLESFVADGVERRLRESPHA